MKDTITDILLPYKEIEFTLLFGSYADDTYSYLSDVDIAIFMKSDIDLLTQGEIIASLESELDKKIDLVILNELYKKDAKLSQNIVNKHTLLFCKDKDAYSDFKIKSLKYYLDLSDMYDMFNKALKSRLNSGTYGKTKAS